MDYREQFEQLISEKRYEEALIYLEQNKIAAHDDAFYYANMGWVLNQLERFHEAYIHLSRGHNRFDDDGWLVAQLGFTCNRLGRVEEGLEYLIASLATGYDEPWLHGEIGWSYHELGEDAKAIPYYENALMEEPNNAWLLKQAAYSYRELGNDEDALYDLKKAHLQEPDDIEITVELIESYGLCNQFETQLSLIKKTHDDELASWLLFQEAQAYLNLDQYNEALIAVEKAYTAGRDDTGLHQSWGDILIALKQDEAAIPHYQRALACYAKAFVHEDVEKREILWEMILLCRKMKDIDQEVYYLKKLVKVDPNHLWALDGLTQYYSNQNEHATAARYLKQMLKIQDDDDARALLAWNLGRLDKNKLAIKQLLICEEHGRNDAWLHNELAWNLACLGQHKKALAQYQEALHQDPKNLWIQTQIAWSLGLLGDHQEAVNLFLKCIKEMNEPDGWLLSNLGWNYHCLKQYEQALFYYEEAKTCGRNDEWINDQIQEVEKLRCEKD